MRIPPGRLIPNPLQPARLGLRSPSADGERIPMSLQRQGFVLLHSVPDQSAGDVQSILPMGNRPTEALARPRVDLRRRPTAFWPAQVDRWPKAFDLTQRTHRVISNRMPSLWP